jgi:hypothetical protein
MPLALFLQKEKIDFNVRTTYEFNFKGKKIFCETLDDGQCIGYVYGKIPKVYMFKTQSQFIEFIKSRGV